MNFDSFAMGHSVGTTLAAAPWKGGEEGKRETRKERVRGSALIVHRLAQDRLEDKWGSTGWKARLLLNVPS